MQPQHRTLEDVVRVDVEGGYFEYIEYPRSLFVCHVEATEKGAGNRVMNAVLMLAREMGKDLWGTINSHGEMDNERLRKWYEKKCGAQVVGDYLGHDLIRVEI